MIKRVLEAGVMPKGYGVAWLDYVSLEAITLPIPINLIVRFWLSIYRWMRFPPKTWHEKVALEVREKAYNEGFKFGALNLLHRMEKQ